MTVATPTHPLRRTCDVCGDRDPCWHGVPARGWTSNKGRDVCPVCIFMAASDDPRGPADGLGAA